MPSLTRSTIAKIESRVRASVSVDEAAALATAFGITVDELFGRQDQAATGDSDPEHDLTDGRLPSREVLAATRAAAVSSPAARVADRDLVGWDVLRTLPSDASSAEVFRAAAEELSRLAADLADEFDVALPFAVREAVFGDPERSRLVMEIGSQQVEITASAISKATAKGIGPLALLASAVTAGVRANDVGEEGEHRILDGRWRPKRIGRAVQPSEEQMRSYRRVARRPQVAQQITEALEQQRDVLIEGPHGSGRTATAAVVAQEFSNRGEGVVWLNLTDPADGPESVVAALLQAEKRAGYLLVVDGLQANLPILDALFSCITRLRREFGLPIKVLATSWSSAAGALERREHDFRPTRIRTDPASTIRQMLDDHEIRGADRARLMQLADNDVHLAAFAIDVFRAHGHPPSDETQQEVFTHGVDRQEERVALYQLACLGVFGLGLPEPEAIGMFGVAVLESLVQRDLIYRTDSAFSVAPRRRAQLIMRYALEHWPEARTGGRPEEIVWTYLQRSDRLIRATLSQIDLLASPERLRSESLDLLSAWDTSERIGTWLQRQTERDPGWGNNLGASVFAGIALARLNHDKDWLSIATALRDRWRYDDPHQRDPEPVEGPTSDLGDFSEIAGQMLLEDRAYGDEGHPSGMVAADFQPEKAYRNWALGLLLCLEGTAPLRYRDSGRINRLLAMAERSVERDGSFYPTRVPWVTARIVIGMCHASSDPWSDPTVARACDWLLSLVQPRPWWRGGTGTWNGDEATTAMCITALISGGAGERGQEAIDNALAWLVSREPAWMSPDREIDLAQVLETLAISTDSPVNGHLQVLLDRTIAELDATTDPPLPDEHLRVPFLAAQLTEVVWRTVQSEFIRLLRDVLGTNESTPDLPPAGAPPGSGRGVAAGT
jgi:transcriptional regulator with XRE-family HTH domain